MNSKKVNIICIVVCVVITLILIGGIIYGVVRNSNDTPPDETQPPIIDTTETDNNATESSIPEIPIVDPDETRNNNQKSSDLGDVTIDILAGDESTERNDSPAIDGDVVIISGAKGEDE